MSPLSRLWSSDYHNSAYLLIEAYENDAQDAFDACMARLDNAKNKQTKQILNSLMDALVDIVADHEVQELDF